MGFPRILSVQTHDIGSVGAGGPITFAAPNLSPGQLLLSIVSWRMPSYDQVSLLGDLSSEGYLSIQGTYDAYPADIGLAIYAIQNGQNFVNTPDVPGFLTIRNVEHVGTEAVTVATVLFEGSYWGADFDGNVGDFVSCPAITSPASGTLAYRIGANFTETSGPFPGIEVFDYAPGEIRIFMSAFSSSLGPIVYPADARVAGADQARSSVGMTLWVSTEEAPYPDISRNDPCPPLRHRQRDDSYETPRARAGPGGNIPTSVNESFRRGFPNTYDGPSNCDDTGCA